MSINQNLYDALIASFCIVAYADQKVLPSESLRFIEVFKEQYPFLADGDDLEKDVKTFIKNLNENYDQAKTRALGKIALFKGDTISSEKIMAVAMTTLVSDGKITQSEELIMAALCEALGLSKDKYCATV